MSRATDWGNAYLRNRYSVLFFSLLASLVMVPLLSALHFSSKVLIWFLLLNILLAGTGAEKSRKRRFLLALAVIAGVRVLGHTLDSGGLMDGSAFALAALTLFAAVGSLVFALRSQRVVAEHVFAALSAYLLAGQFFGILAATVERVAPGSYTGASVPGPGNFPLSQAIYFSYVTLATVGYGDIVPTTDIARGIAVVETVAGQLYMAVLVARLVSGYAPRGSS